MMYSILPKTNIAFDKIAETQKERRMSSNHQFSGAFA